MKVMPNFDYSKLRGAIVEKFNTQREFCLSSGMSEATLTAKLTNKVFFSQREIAHICQLLGIPGQEVSAYFFTEKVEKTKPTQ